MPGPASSIGRVLANYDSNPSLNTGGTYLAPVANNHATLIFQILFDKWNCTCMMANFYSLDWAKGNVARSNWLSETGQILYYATLHETNPATCDIISIDT